VGEIEQSVSNANDKKNGKGMIRWQNGNIFEGTFANDVMQSGNFIESGKSVTLTITSGVATLGGQSGTFNMNDGTFTQNP
jgi:hypothetical protein